MIKACEKASKILIRDFGEIEKLQVSKKGPSDFVTNSDLKTEKIIIEELSKGRPDYSIISEENGVKNNKDSKNTWIIDPIDGTINFLHGVPHFATSIALKHNNEIVSGLIFDPIKDEMFYAEKNNGAYLNNKRIRVSKKNNMKECLFATSGVIEKKMEFSFRKTGSAALDMAYIACGRFDGYFQKNLNLWDIAAGLILVEEAGGIINKLDLNNYQELKIIASSPNINSKLMDKISNF